MRPLLIATLVVFAGCSPGGDYKAGIAAAAAVEGSRPTEPDLPAGVCPDCGGEGKVGDGRVMVDCQACGGDGRIDDAQLAKPDPYREAYENVLATGEPAVVVFENPDDFHPHIREYFQLDDRETILEIELFLDGEKVRYREIVPCPPSG